MGSGSASGMVTADSETFILDKESGVKLLMYLSY